MHIHCTLSALKETTFNVIKILYAYLAPEYSQRLFSQQNAEYNLRNLKGKLTLPKPSGACLYNNLPQYLRNADSIWRFKRTIKQVSDLSDSHTAAVKRFLLFLFSLTDDFPCLNKVYLLTYYANEAKFWLWIFSKFSYVTSAGKRSP